MLKVRSGSENLLPKPGHCRVFFKLVSTIKMLIAFRTMKHFFLRPKYMYVLRAYIML